MMRKLVILAMASLLALVMSGCGTSQSDHSSASSPTEPPTSYGSQPAAASTLSQTGFTEAVPAAYRQTSSQPGDVERMDYESRDYAGDGSAITKTAYVYKPYGYDPNDGSVRYDIVYLMHGWGGHAGEYFELANVKDMLDNMIERGDIRPTIFVSATFYHDGSGDDFTSSVAELRAFHQDFENHLMPAVEGAYHTYAAGTSPDELKAARDHRAFGGFSLGAVTTWMAFCYDYDYIRYFLPMSGSCWYYGGYGDFQTQRNVDFIEQLVAEHDLDKRGYLIFEGVGTDDPVKAQTIMMMDEMLGRGDVFGPEHLAFYQKEGGGHDFDSVREFMYNALPHFFTESHEGEGGSEVESPSFEPFTLESSIDEVAADPAFGDWGRMLFPVQRGYLSGSTLGDMQLTWYNFIDPDMTVEICNYLKGRALAGETVFLDIYTDEEKATDPAKADTGLVFFRGDADVPTAIVNAGGGFAYVGAMHDSFPHCLELSKRGYNAFALIYRPGAQTACEDLARAIAYLHEHAGELGISMDGYSLWGGSAGARMAAWIGAYGTEAFGEAAYPRPAACIVNYTGLSEVTGAEPPTYSVVGTSDWIADWRTMQARIERIQANGTDAQIEVFDGLPHGFGLGTGTNAEGWLDRAVAFWEKQL